MKVLQLIDSLHPGGAERMAISLANGLASNGIESHICVTREEGLLRRTILGQVSYLFLRKKRTLDIGAFRRLKKYISKHRIDVIHAHSSSFFLATWVKYSLPKVRLIWHDHFGESEALVTRKSKILRMCSRTFDGIISVNSNLEDWARQQLRCEQVVYLRNFVDTHPLSVSSVILKGKPGHRIVCLANFRPQKDHFTLLDAFRMLPEKHRDWSLHLIGKKVDHMYSEAVEKKIVTDDLKEVYLYGEQQDVMAMLTQAEIGVLSSRSEGLPVTLLEYGVAGLAVLATRVGQCEAVVSEYGSLVSAGSAEEFATALSELIEDRELRKSRAMEFRRHIESEYTFESIKPELLKLYTKNV